MDDNKLKDNFIRKAKTVHGDKYDYSKVDYQGSTKKVEIICPEHGSFYQLPSAHLRNQCPLCANEARRKALVSSKEEFILKAREIHGWKYDYSKVEYKNAETKVCIICPLHGEFWMRPSSHLLGNSCPKCMGRGLSQEDVIEEFKKLHGDRYDYSLVEYRKMHDKVKVVCPEHGVFEITPSKHLLGQGCKKCAYIKNGLSQRLSMDEFLKRAKEAHGDYYGYKNVSFLRTHDKIEIECPKHGIFSQLVYDHLNGHGCPKCSNTFSKGETELFNQIVEWLREDKVIAHNRTVLEGGQELDIFIPSMNIAVEYNGLKWHSEEYGKMHGYHLRKTEECEAKGIQLIQIFEDEWLKKKPIVLNQLIHVLSVPSSLPKVHADDCYSEEISIELGKRFLNEYCLNGYSPSTVIFGAFFHGCLIGAIGFKKHKDAWMISCMAIDYKFKCVGVLEKAFSSFVRGYNPAEVYGYADRRWFSSLSENFFTNAGFCLSKIIKPSYEYISTGNPTKRISKFELNKKSIHRKYHLSMDYKEKDVAKCLKLTKIWNCGSLKYVWKRDS